MKISIAQMSRQVGLFLGVFGWLVSLDNSRANLLQNGGFEQGTVIIDGHADTPVPWTSSDPLNPNVSWDTWHNTGVNGLPPTFFNVFNSTLAAGGQRWVGGWNFENMAQQLGSPFLSGQTYSVSALIRMSDFTQTASGRLDIYLGSGVGNYDHLAWSSPFISFADGWVVVSGSFVAPSMGGPLSYLIPKFEGADGWSVYMGLDDIQLSVVPEPTSATLLGLGLTFFLRRIFLTRR